MKKALLTIIVGCTAAIASAEKANWGVGVANLFDGNGETASKVSTGTSVYMFDAELMSQENLYKAFKADTSLDFTAATGYAATLQTTGDGVLTATKDAAKFSYGERTTLDDTYNYSFYFAIADGDKIYLSNALVKTAGGTDAAVTLGYGSQTTAPADSKALPTDGFVSGGHWAAVPAPEPTSGMLLLLGMAGLALKRKRV